MVNTVCHRCGKTLPYESRINIGINFWACPECWVLSPNQLEPTAEDEAFEEIERRQQAGIVHPLLNPESKHYSMVDDVEAIIRMEQLYSTEELMVWAKITSMKYRLRIGNKDDVLKEAKKIETYEAYYMYLKEKVKC